MSFPDSLLDWYDTSGRVLPWRQHRNPYLTWISEIMLQQTQVDTVIPYFNRWRTRFPDVRTLAEAEFDELLKSWEGLGYYSRCRNIHKTAKIIIDEHSGIIPDTYSQLIELPGIGDYTAGAILSMGFNRKAAAVDANVIRVMSRVLFVDKLTDTGTRKKVQSETLELVPENRPGDFNQALMDLGNLVCRPGKPICSICPVKKYCKAFKLELQEKIPPKKEKKRIPAFTVVAGMIWKGNRFYIQKRGPTGHLGGLWEFPGGKVEQGENHESALKREVMEECGFRIRIKGRIGQVSHAYSHFSINLIFFQCTLKVEYKTVREPRETDWITMKEINNYAFPKANHKLFHLIKQGNP